MSDLTKAIVRVGYAGLNGTGLTSGEKSGILADIAALQALTPPTSIDQLTDVDLTGIAVNDLLRWDGGQLVKYTPTATTIEVVAGFLVFDGGATITTGIKGDLPQLPFAGTITGVAAAADQSGSVAFQFWKDSWANYPPVLADSLGTLTMSSQIKSPTTGTWTAVSWPFAAGDVIRVNCSTAATSITRVTLSFRIERSV